MPLISVIIPAYNSEKTIRETIESVLQQTFSDFELIVINDSSKDATLEIVNSIKDSRVKVFSYPNAGVAVSRNRGFSLSSGKFIAFLDADDLWTEDKLEAQLKALQDNPKAGVAYSLTSSLNEASQFVRNEGHIVANGNVYAQLLLTAFIVSGSNPLIRREAFIEVGGFDESLAASQDFDLYLRLAARYDFAAVPKRQVLYRLSPNSMSTNLRRWEKSSVLVREKAFECSPKPLPADIKRHSIANFYKVATWVTLDRFPSRSTAWEAGRMLWQAMKYDPELWKTMVIWKIFLKISLLVLLPLPLSAALLTKFKRISNSITLLRYLKEELDTETNLIKENQ